ncbi:hypothetical protein B0J13DRAFT_490228 [Dactylonectria estremocensis]|uniref:BZIP domain-containing protein n=1 Tax=Dactylonectria estremocensis TaxID=1079267 RepID=A0A9P9CY43_9HYPO|nr:hypothetical protein B0J13DRAFT_490228 [Dactylonectria estremocensis]
MASSKRTEAPKRRCTRSTMTPSQLARKRANDREAQRTIRARTKAYIEHLEREIEEIKSKQSRDWTVQKLLRHKEALENELRRLRDNQRVIFMSPSPFSMTVCDESGIDTGAILDLWSLPDLCGYNSFPDDDQHVPLPSSHEQWSTKTDNYGAGYKHRSGMTWEYI